MKKFAKVCDTQVQFDLEGAWVTCELTETELLIRTFYQDGEHGVRCIGVDRISYTKLQGGYGQKIDSTYDGRCSGSCGSCNEGTQ